MHRPNSTDTTTTKPWLLATTLLLAWSVSACGLSIDDVVEAANNNNQECDDVTCPTDDVTDVTETITCADYTGPEQVLALTSPPMGTLGELLKLDPQDGEIVGGLADVGDVPNRVRMCGNRAYVVNSISHDIHVVDAETMKSKAVIALPDGSNPMDVAFASGKGFVSGWGNDKVYVFDVSTSTLATVTLDSPTSPQGMYATEQTVFVANTGTDRTDYHLEAGSVTVIDAASATVTATVDVGCKNPMWIEGQSDRVFVMCGGEITYGPAPDYAMTVVSKGQIVELSATTHAVVGRLELDNNPGSLAASDDLLLLGGAGAGLSTVTVDPLAIDVPPAQGVLAWEDVSNTSVDADGRVWVAQWFQKMVKILDSEYATETTVDVGANAQDIVYLAPVAK